MVELGSRVVNLQTSVMAVFVAKQAKPWRSEVVLTAEVAEDQLALQAVFEAAHQLSVAEARMFAVEVDRKEIAAVAVEVRMDFVAVVDMGLAPLVAVQAPGQGTVMAGFQRLARICSRVLRSKY